jgi:hypothetical protein
MRFCSLAPAVSYNVYVIVCVLHLSQIKTLDTLDSFIQIQPRLFFRSNPMFRSICEHCLLCLGNLFC